MEVETVKIKGGEYVSASGLLEWLQQAGREYNLPHLLKIQKPHNLDYRRKENKTIPEPEFRFGNAFGWNMRELEAWLQEEIAAHDIGMENRMKMMSAEERRKLYEELKKELGEN